MKGGRTVVVSLMLLPVAVDRLLVGPVGGHLAVHLGLLLVVVGTVHVAVVVRHGLLQGAGS